MNDILKLNVGIAGCGTMGLPMLEVLLKNGVNAFGYDVKSKENFPTLKENFISSKVNFFEKSDIIFSAVRDINQTVELCEGKNGLFKVNAQKILIISSTLSPAFLENIYEDAIPGFNSDQLFFSLSQGGVAILTFNIISLPSAG